jgi:hypothetical protein
MRASRGDDASHSELADFNVKKSRTTMSMIGRCALFLAGFFLLSAAGVGSSSAQDNLDAGKKPAQLFASDCGGCHKSPVGLSKAPGLFGLESFLREHYTASRQTAAAIAAYIQSVDAEQPPARAPAKRRKSEPRPKSADKPAESAKPAEARPADVKPAAEDSKKASTEKPAEPKASQSKPADPPAATAAPASKPDKSD